MTDGPLELARRHRPANFGEMTGQRASVALLYLMAKYGTVPPVVLLHGERGCGKTTLARILAMALNCAAEPGPAREWPCGACPSCTAIQAGVDGQGVEEIDAASCGSVEEIRKLILRAQYSSGGAWMVYILDEVHRMSPEAFDAMLKMLEEPPPRTIFVFVTTKPGAVPDTVHSRASEYAVRPLPPEAIRARLVHIAQAEGIEAEDGLLDAIAESARGGMRDAIMKLDQMASARISSLELWQELTGETDFAPVLLGAAADGDHPALFAALDEALASAGDPGHVTSELIRCLRDLLVLSQGAQIALQGRALEARTRLAAEIGPARIAGAMQVLWELMAKVRSEDRVAGLTLALVMVSRRLCALPLPETASISPPGGQRASLEELRTLAVPRNEPRT